MSLVTINLFAEAMWTNYQVCFSADGRIVATIGALFSVIAIFSVFSSYIVRYLIKSVAPVRLMQAVGFGAFCTALILLQPNHTLRLLAVLPLALGSGFTTFTLTATAQYVIAI